MARGSSEHFRRHVFNDHDADDEPGYAGGGGIHIKPSHKGLMHKDLGKPADAPITSSDIAKEKAKGGAAKKRAVFAENARKWHH